MTEHNHKVPRTACGPSCPANPLHEADREAYKGEAHYWTEDADGDPVLPAKGKCPTCRSDAPEKNATVHREGNASICRDPWHSSTHAGREAMNKAIGHAYADQQKSAADERKTVVKWADEAMFTAEPIDTKKGPQVHLLWMTPDPLAAIAGPSKMYKGETVRSFRDVTHAERHEFVQEIMKTKLQMPFEAVKFHFVIEGVTRAFTHQMVRQRTAAYAQRSDRFAVQEGETLPVALPPSLAGTKGVWRDHEKAALSVYPDREVGDFDVERFVGNSMVRESDAERQRWTWDKTVEHIDASQKNLVAQGMPQEDARGLLPTNLLTTIHYITDLRALLDHGGNRLCTQAQFEWRLVFSRIRQAIREYLPYAGLKRQLRNIGEKDATIAVSHCEESDRWQYETIADLFKPVCYLTGKCEFKANFDRKCNIRSRVDAYHERGVSSEQWGEGYTPRDDDDRPGVGPIFPAEWLLNPGAAR